MSTETLCSFFCLCQQAGSNPIRLCTTGTCRLNPLSFQVHPLSKQPRFTQFTLLQDGRRLVGNDQGWWSCAPLFISASVQDSSERKRSVVRQIIMIQKKPLSRVSHQDVFLDSDLGGMGKQNKFLCVSGLRALRAHSVPLLMFHRCSTWCFVSQSF